jgi:integrase
MEVEGYRSVAAWLRAVSSGGTRSEATRRCYLHFLRRFCEFAGKSPDELVAERREHLRSGDEDAIRGDEDLVAEWQERLEGREGLSRGSVATAVAVIKSFYSANRVPLQLKRPKTWLTRVRKTPTREELRAMVEACNCARDRAVILCLAQSGMSLGDFLSQLTVGKVAAELWVGVRPIHISAERRKAMVRYDTFIGNDGSQAMEEYLEDVGLGPIEWNLGKVADAPVFRLSPRLVQHIVRRAGERAGLDAPVTPHRLRSFFSTRMKLAGCPDALVEYWMGHTMPYGGAYFIPPVEEQREIYRRHEWTVSVGR